MFPRPFLLPHPPSLSKARPTRTRQLRPPDPFSKAICNPILLDLLTCASPCLTWTISTHSESIHAHSHAVRPTAFPALLSVSLGCTAPREELDLNAPFTASINIQPLLTAWILKLTALRTNCHGRAKPRRTSGKANTFISLSARVELFKFKFCNIPSDLKTLIRDKAAERSR